MLETGRSQRRYEAMQSKRHPEQSYRCLNATDRQMKSRMTRITISFKSNEGAIGDRIRQVKKWKACFSVFRSWFVESVSATGFETHSRHSVYSHFFQPCLDDENIVRSVPIRMGMGTSLCPSWNCCLMNSDNMRRVPFLANKGLRICFWMGTSLINLNLASSISCRYNLTRP